MIAMLNPLSAIGFEEGLEREAMQIVSSALVAPCEAFLDSSQTGIIVASDNAGTATALRFWEDALKVGVGVASPELFPWCLANAPSAALARHLRITGPNSTYLGERDALLAALDTAEIWLSENRVDQVLLVVITFCTAKRPGSALAFRVSKPSSAESQCSDSFRPQKSDLPETILGCMTSLSHIFRMSTPTGLDPE